MVGNILDWFLQNSSGNSYLRRIEENHKKTAIKRTKDIIDKKSKRFKRTSLNWKRRTKKIVEKKGNGKKTEQKTSETVRYL